MGSSDQATIIKQEQTPCSPYYSFERPKSKSEMKLSLIITLIVAAVSYASPLQSNLDISSSAQTTDHQRMRRSANGCPYQVEVKYSTSADQDSGPYKLLKEFYGKYTIQNGHIGGRDWYLSSDGENAIWYDTEYGKWRLGYESKKDTTWCVFYTSDDDKCPHQPAFDWKYFVPAINQFIDANRGMTIYET